MTSDRRKESFDGAAASYELYRAPYPDEVVADVPISEHDSGSTAPNREMTPSGEWDPDADNWIRWARTPGHDAYWYYRDAFFDEVVPPPGRRCVEIGCGEGRVARDLTSRGHTVTGIDSSLPLLRSARDADTDTSCVLADSPSLPFPDASFDLAVAYNSLQVVDDMPGTMRETARVLAPGGVLCAVVSHPLTDLGRFVDDAPDAPLAIRQDYFASRRVEDTVQRGGLQMTFRGWTYSLEDYAIAVARAGLVIDAIREPRPSGAPSMYSRWSRIPMFLMFRAQKH